MSDFYKKLESGSTTGNLIDRNSVKEIVGSSVDLDDATELVAAGYVKMEIVEIVLKLPNHLCHASHVSA